MSVLDHTSNQMTSTTRFIGTESFFYAFVRVSLFMFQRPPSVRRSKDNHHDTERPGDSESR